MFDSPLPAFSMLTRELGSGGGGGGGGGGAHPQPASGGGINININSSSLLSNGIGASDIEILHSASLPSSPIHGACKSETPTRKAREEVLKAKCRHLSPLLRRKGNHGAGAGDTLDDDLVLTVLEDFKGGQTYHNLETFQKAQLKHKVGGYEVQRYEDVRAGVEMRF